MTEQKEKIIRDMVMKMKQMDMKSVNVIKISVDALSAKEAMDAADAEPHKDDAETRKLA